MKMYKDEVRDFVYGKGLSIVEASKILGYSKNGLSNSFSTLSGYDVKLIKEDLTEYLERGTCEQRFRKKRKMSRGKSAERMLSYRGLTEEEAQERHKAYIKMKTDKALDYLDERRRGYEQQRKGR